MPGAYSAGRALDWIAAAVEVGVDLAQCLAARLIELGEVRNAPTVTAARVTSWSAHDDGS